MNINDLSILLCDLIVLKHFRYIFAPNLVTQIGTKPFISLKR
jgi:hypothetical protein